MKVVAKIVNPGLTLLTRHELYLARDNEHDSAFVEESARADLVLVKTLEDYALVRHLKVPKAFHIVTDDPNAATWHKLDEIFRDPWVRGILAPTEQVLWHWQVPTGKAYLFPKCTTFTKTHPWIPRIPRFVVLLNEAQQRWWHVGADILEHLGKMVPITVIGRGNDHLQNVEVLPEIPHERVSEVVSQYTGAFMPYRYSASPNWMVEAMFQGMPIVSTDFDYARIHIPAEIRRTEFSLHTRMQDVLDNPTEALSYENKALYTFSPARCYRMVDAVLDDLV